MSNYNNIPAEIRNLNQWVGFIKIQNANGKTTKKPVDVRTLQGASSTNPNTWNSFEEATMSIGRVASVGGDAGVIDGIGFVFAPPYCGIDIDHCINTDTGEINAKALDIINQMDSYTELSPSRTGIHILYKGEVHKGEWKCKKADALGNGIDIEMYQQGRYFTVTGEIYGDNHTINERENIADLIQKIYFQPQTQSKSTVSKNYDINSDDILNLAMNSKNGMMFSDLYNGKWNKYFGSQSEADLSFCNMLAFWCGKDYNLMDKFFRSSGLMRDKWDRKQSGTTYGAITLNKAIENCTNVYTPSKPNNDFSITITSRTSKKYTFDDTGNAQRLKDLFGDKIRFNYVDKKWMLYNKNKWTYDIVGYIWTLIDKTVEKMQSESEFYKEDEEIEKNFHKHIKKSRSNNSKRALEREVQHYLPVTYNEFDRDKMALNTPNGIINLHTFQIKDNSANEYFTKSTNVSYVKGAECPLWKQFLNDIFDNDKNLIRYIQKMVGYCLTGSTAEQCVFFLHGAGSNGKSTFIDVIREMMGDYASNIQPETIMVKNTSSSASSDIARLKGARFVTSVEPNEGVSLNEGLIKQLTGDDMVTARKLYGNEFEFKPEFKLLMATNHKPKIRGTDTGIWRRIHLIPFTVQISDDKKDRHLKEKLLAEIEGVFGWALNGLALYQKEGLEMPTAVKNAVSEYRAEMDVISSFLSDCTVDKPGSIVKASMLYSVYQNWCDTNNEYKMPNSKFSIEIQKKYQRTKTKKGNVYSDLDFNEEYKPYSICN